MADKPRSPTATFTFLNIFSVLLQILVMVLLATDRINTSVAVSLLGMVLLTGFFLPMALKKAAKP